MPNTKKKLTLDPLRTEGEILAIADQCHRSQNFLMLDEIVKFLPHEMAKVYVASSVTADDWDENQWLNAAPVAVIERAREYNNDIAWRGVHRHQPLLAERTWMNIRVWAWLMGDDDLLAEIEKSEMFPLFGAPALKKFCDFYEFPTPSKPQVVRMTEGLPCGTHCLKGCISDVQA